MVSGTTKILEQGTDAQVKQVISLQSWFISFDHHWKCLALLLCFLIINGYHNNLGLKADSPSYRDLLIEGWSLGS